MSKVIYLDNNATTRVAPEVVEAMRPFLGEMYGNASSMHSFGGQVRKHVERAREQVAALLGAEPSEIVFTSCGTESDNAALRGTVEAHAGRRHHVVTTRVEHPAVLSTCRYLGSRGCRLSELPVDREGLLDLQMLDDLVTDDTAIVSVMWANNETGVIFPVEEIARLCQRKGVAFHTDAVQAVGKIPVDLRRTPIDLLALSGHKLHAPKGVGVLYIRKGTRLAPFMIGGHQEGGKRAGTENVPYIVALGVAAELAAKHMREEVTRVPALRDRLEAGILASCPDAHVNGRRDQRLPNTADIGFEFVEGESILMDLDVLGICASSGSACTSGSLEPSHVLRAMGIPFTAAHGSIRFSLSRYNTQDEIDFVVAHMPPIIHRLRELSPFVPKGKA
ncbi:MAG TPA: cysteine desulfurase NifS [Planctomycetota bacterium]|nr:cysteine desulfurase NifS [Planctomycetota bacterium]